MAAHTINITQKTSSKARASFALKVGIALVLVLGGAYGLLYEHAYISSSDAIMSAYLYDVRTPIDGFVTGLPGATGVAVQRGQSLGHLDNVRVDHQQLDLLTTEASQAEIAANAAYDEQTSLEAQRESLMTRANEHTSAVASRLELQATEATRVLAARRLAQQQASIELERGKKLHEAGILPTAAYDQLLSAERIAAEEVAAQDAQLASLREQISSAARGFLSEPGMATEVGYSRQRADEIAMRLSETRRTLTTAKEQARQAQLLLASETTQLELRAHTDLVSPVDGVLWNLDSMNGERVGIGDTVLSVVSCSRPFLLVDIPQDRVPEIAIQGRAKFRLSGEAVERTGTVVSVSGSTERSGRKFASRPVHKGEEQVATVLVRPDTTGAAEAGRPESCDVGRTAHVLLPTVPTTGVSAFFARLF